MTKYGRLAYKMSTSDELSIETLKRRLAELERIVEPLVAQQSADWDVVAMVVAEAGEVQRRLSLAVSSADDDEFAPL